MRSRPKSADNGVRARAAVSDVIANREGKEVVAPVAVHRVVARPGKHLILAGARREDHIFAKAAADKSPAIRTDHHVEQVWHTAVEYTFLDLGTILIAVDGADQDQSASQRAKAS